MLAGVLWGATTLAVRATRLGQASAEKTLLYQLAGLGAAAAGGGRPVGGAPLPHRLSTLAWAALLFQVVVVTFASYLLWFWLIRHYPATRLSSFTMLTPVFGLLLGALLLAEPVTGRLLFALATVAAGIFLVNRKTAVTEPLVAIVAARRRSARRWRGGLPAGFSAPAVLLDARPRRHRCWRGR